MKLLLKLVVSFVFLGVAVLLSAGIVRIVERPVAPWKHPSQMVPAAKPWQPTVDEQRGSMKLDPVLPAGRGTPVELGALVAADPARWVDLALPPQRETWVEDLAEASTSP